MPAYTPEFTALKTRLNELAQVLPKNSNIGSIVPTARDVDLMSAFVVLTHAACEDFMERRALQVATAAKAGFDAGGVLGRVGKHLCIFPFLEIPKQMADLHKLSKMVGSTGFGIMARPSFVAANRADVGRLLNIGFQRFKQSVENNHGASFKYQFKLLSMLGFDLARLGNNFSSRIAQLAEYRGEAAHTKVVAASTRYPSTTLATWPADLIEGYRRMDVQLTALASRVN